MGTEQQPEHESAPERAPPRIYVADLAAYNNGHLHGAWIDANRGGEEVWEDVNTMLAHSPIPGAEEFAIHDYEGFEGWRPTEFEPISDVAAVARAIHEHGLAISHWIDYLGEPSRAIDSFEDAYLGNWRSSQHYTEEMVEDMGVRITVEPESWRSYVTFDTAALARDLEFELHIAGDGDGGVHIFAPHAADQ